MRYERHHALKHIGKEGQEVLGKKTTAIVGVGAIGTVSAELLARAGVNLVLIDHDTIDLTNLQRQLLYTEDDIGRKKAETAAEKLKKINSDVEIRGHNAHLTYDNMDLLNCDLILDCTDNMDTRFLINDYSLKNKIPWIYAAAVEDRGMLYVVNGSPCFNCIFENANSIENCDNHGILNAASAQIASVQVTEAIKILLHKPSAKELMHFNFWSHEIKKLRVKKNENCNSCQGKYSYLEEPEEDYKLRFCERRKAMNARPLRKMNLDIKLLKKQFKVLSEAPFAINVDGEDILVYDYGELYFRNEKDQERLKGLTEKIYSAARI